MALLKIRAEASRIELNRIEYYFKETLELHATLSLSDSKRSVPITDAIYLERTAGLPPATYCKHMEWPAQH